MSLQSAGVTRLYVDGLALILDRLAAAGVTQTPATVDERRREILAEDVLSALSRAGFIGIAEKLRYGLAAAAQASYSSKEGDAEAVSRLVDAVLEAAAQATPEASEPHRAPHRGVTAGAISTGALTLDIALGVGGLPRGRIVEVFGPPASGKTTLAYHLIAEAQHRGDICAFIDAQHVMAPAYARRIGVNIDELLVSQPETSEQAFEIAELLVRSGALAVVAIDSLEALVPAPEISSEPGAPNIAVQARLMSQALRKLAATAHRAGTICLFTTQVPETTESSFGSSERTPGGRALKFYASVRLDIRRIESFEEGAETVGSRVRVKVVKNKVARPFKQAEFDIIYGEGISWERSVIDAALELGVLTRVASSLRFGDRVLGPNKGEAASVLRADETITHEIISRIQAVAGTDVVVTTREMLV